jgi:hypothetical protein
VDYGAKRAMIREGGRFKQNISLAPQDFLIFFTSSQVNLR